MLSKLLCMMKEGEVCSWGGSDWFTKLATRWRKGRREGEIALLR